MQPTRRRIWMFRLLAILLSLSPLIALESGLRLAGWKSTNEVIDPYVGFADSVPLFERSADGQRMETSRLRFPLFKPDSFDAEKPPREFRVFCVGGSTVQGRPFSIETSFTRWLEISLNAASSAASSDRTFQVINCGGVSYASYRLVPIVKEIVNYQPDLIIVYTGHNEFLEDRTYAEVKRAPAWIHRGHHWLSGLRSYQLVRSWATEDPTSKPAAPPVILPTDAEAILDFRGGLDQYQRDLNWQAGVILHYELNLRSMVEVARAHDVEILFCNPVSDLRDTPPFKSEFDPNLKPSDRELVQAQWDQLNQLEFVESGFEAVALKRIIGIDPGYAAAHYRLGQAYDVQQNFELARKHYLRAKDHDVCPLRMLESMHRILDRVCRETRTQLVDVRKRFESRAKNGIPGRDVLIDHVHPQIAGHQWIAEQLIEEYFQPEKRVSPGPQWESERNRQYQAHLEQLPNMYFERGLDRLRGLQRWSAGKVTRERGEPLKPAID